MAKEMKEACCFPNGSKCVTGFKVESVIGVDERGQMILPKEIRDKANIKAGEKLAVVSWEKDGKVCCISLIKASDLVEMVGDMLGPMMREITGS